MDVPDRREERTRFSITYIQTGLVPRGYSHALCVLAANRWTLGQMWLPAPGSGIVRRALTGRSFPRGFSVLFLFSPCTFPDQQQHAHPPSPSLGRPFPSLRSPIPRLKRDLGSCGPSRSTSETLSRPLFAALLSDPCFPFSPVSSRHALAT